MATLLDTHCHYDFLTGEGARSDFLASLAERGVRIVAQTLTPSSFAAEAPPPASLVDETLEPSLSVTAMSCSFSFSEPGPPPPLWSVGFHPWHIASEDQADAELALFADAITRTRFVGEIGLDFSPRRLDATPARLQRGVLREVLRLVREAADHAPTDDPYVLSIHAVRSAGDVLDLLDETDARGHNVVPVFHRFSGTSDDLTRLVRMGGYISVHPQMLAGKRGRAYVRQVPIDRLLLETDLPAQPTDAVSGNDAACETADAMASTLTALENVRGDDVAAALARTQARLYQVV